MKASGKLNTSLMVAALILAVSASALASDSKDNPPLPTSDDGQPVSIETDSVPVMCALDETDSASYSSSSSSFPTAVDGHPLPKEIGGMPVIFVHTAANTGGLQPGEVRIALLDTAASPDDSPENVSVLDFMQEAPEGWTVTVVWGISEAEYERLSAEANEFYEKNGPGPKSSTVSIESSPATMSAD
ncbi:MAG: hypothetical protein IBX68_07200 [Dehalococcoidia bacterium]|nr:hypothetical protein [Dehalococcoidia bacterium]